MLNRRTLLTAAPLVAASPAFPAPAPDSFPKFVEGVKAEAARAGIRQTTLDKAFKGVVVNQRVIELDRKQPEFTLTWEQYRGRVVSEGRIAKGRDLFARHRGLLSRVTEKYGVGPAPIMGIWGLESDYGASTGGFHVIEALATLAWEGRRAAFFRSELMDALKIIEAGDITPERMTGSYAGAMGQPQFMPDSYLKFAVDFSGTGKRDIWNDPGDIFASVANYLAKSGWNGALPWGVRRLCMPSSMWSPRSRVSMQGPVRTAAAAPWGVPARLPAGFDAVLAGRDNRKTLADWTRLGVVPGRKLPPETMAAVLLPGGAGGEAYLACHPNFLAIRRYNPSDFYCISVGLIGERVTA